jgi:DNA polymerase-2
MEARFGNVGEITRFARWVSRNYPMDFELFNLGVPPAQSYMYIRDIFPLAFVEVHSAHGELHWQLLDEYSRTNYAVPPFKTARVKVTTRKQGAVRSIYDPVETIEVSASEERIVIDSKSEAENILSLAETVKRLDPDVLLTADGDSFIFPLLFNRARANGIENKLVLDREGRAIQMSKSSGKVYFSYGRIFYKPTPSRLLGRLHLDTSTDFLFEDCSEHGLFEVARTCRTPLHRASRETIGTNMTSLQMYVATRNDILIPWRKNDPENFKSAKELLIADRGGLIFEPRVGAYDNVGELDFVSLYPALMMKENLTPECISCNCCPDCSSRVPDLNYPICERRVGIIPKTLRILLQKRADYKHAINSTRSPYLREIYEKRQAALKWILVCSFGYLGYKNARFGKIDAHIAVCAFSRKILRQATSLAEKAGFSVVHGIVDSLWVRKPDASNLDFFSLARKIQETLQLPVGYEGRYRWIVFLSSRMHPKVPVLNRYYGVFENGTIKTRGIELRRRDTPKIIKLFQEEFLGMLSKCPNLAHVKLTIPSALRILENYVRRVVNHEVTFEDLAFHRQLSKDTLDYAHSTSQAVAARKLHAEGAHVSAGQVISYVILDQDARTPWNRSLPIELGKAHDSYDETKYTDLLIDSAANLLAPLGWNKQRIMRFLNLFPAGR